MTLLLSALGVDVAVRGLDADTAALLARLWAGCRPDPTRPHAGEPSVVDVHASGAGWRAVTHDRTWSVDGRTGAVAAVGAAVNHLVTARTPLLAFHAAVVVQDGLAVVLPGESGAGKTTVTAAMVQRGWSYVSDEALALDWTTGAMVRYPRPLALSAWTSRALGLDGGSHPVSGGETWLSTTALGAAEGLLPARRSTIVLLDRQRPTGAGAGVQLHRPHRAEALRALLARSFTLHHDPARALVLLADLCRASRVVGLGYSDAREVAAEALQGILR